MEGVFGVAGDRASLASEASAPTVLASDCGSSLFTDVTLHLRVVSVQNLVASHKAHYFFQKFFAIRKPLAQLVL